eukprot:Hpha_TRINITY_DN11075_c0_g1::TRINITY_DN11075_c0_g1_i2::g.93040::m.93040/K03321/TC.SULP; sulfate permease, SulP family
MDRLLPDELLRPTSSQTWHSARFPVSPLLQASRASSICGRLEGIDAIDVETDSGSSQGGEASAVGRFMRGVIYGLISAVLSVPALVGYTSVIFQHQAFAPYRPQLVKLVLWSSFVHQVTFSLRSRMPFAMGQVQDAGLIFLSAMATSTVQLVPPDPATGLPGPQAVPTACITLALATALLGVALMVTSYLRAASFVQYLPMPVISGYLAFIGLFCVEAGLGLSTGLDVNTHPQSWPQVLETPRARTFTGLAMLCGSTLLFVSRKCQSPGALPLTFLLLPAGFYGSLYLTSTSLMEARAEGWLTTSRPEAGGAEGFKELFAVFDFGLVDWHVVARQGTTWLGMYFVVAFSSCLDVAAIEMDLGEPLDANAELGKVVGLSNLISGLTGGFTGSYIISLTVFTMRTCKHTRVCGGVCAFCCLAVVLLPFSPTDFVPPFIFAGCLVFIGLDLLFCWLVDQCRRLAFQESGVVVCAFVLINIAGLELGLVLGIVVSAAVFLFSIAKAPAALRISSSSTVCWDPAQQEHLQAHRAQIVQLQLFGHLFFGSASTLLKAVRRQICVPAEVSEDTPLQGAERPLAALAALQEVVTVSQRAEGGVMRARYVVFDFSRVRGLDTSAVRTCFLTLRMQLASHDIIAVFCGMSPSVEEQFRRNDFLDDPGSCLVCAGPDEALALCEYQILEQAGLLKKNSLPPPLPDAVASGRCACSPFRLARASAEGSHLLSR